MEKVYKYILTILIVSASIYFTYDHYTDPIYNLRVGLSVNASDGRIEDRGERIQIDAGKMYIGFNTRLETGTTVNMNVVSNDGFYGNLSKEFYITPSYNFYFMSVDSFLLAPGNYTVFITVDGEEVETLNFTMEDLQVDN